MSVFRPRHADGDKRLVGANLAPVYAPLRIGRPADVYCGKITRNVNRILCTGQPGFTSLLKIQILPNAGLLRRLRRETGRFQNYANRVTGARESARRTLAICRIPCACASDQPSRAMHKLSMCRIACACAPAAAASTGAVKKRTGSAMLSKTHRC